MEMMSKKKQLQHEFSRFFIFGLFTTFTDFLVYSFGHHFLPYSIAKACSFIVGSCLAYLLNKHFTFKQKQHSQSEMIRFATLYVSSMLVNVTVNSVSIMILKNWWIVPWLSHNQVLIVAFLAATGASTVINFTGQKFWVFKKIETIVGIG